MAFPVILVDFAGSDTAASGAGPSTALTGSNNASTDGAGTTVTLPSGTDLTNVSTSGDHAIYLNDTTAGHRRTARIVGKAGSGGASPTVTVSEAYTGSLSGITWAIGGQRQTIGSTSSRLLFDNNGAAGDLQPGWAVELPSSYTEVLTSSLLLRCAGDVTNGPITLRGALTALAKPILTWNINDIALRPVGASLVLDNLDLRNSNVTKTASVAIYNINSADTIFRRLTIAHATDNFWVGIEHTGFGMLDRSTIRYTASHGIVADLGAVEPVAIYDTQLLDAGGAGFWLGAGDSVTQVSMRNCIIARSGTVGMRVRFAGTVTRRGDISHNAFDANASHGFEVDGTVSDDLTGGLMENNIFSNNGGYGLKFVSLTAAELRGRGFLLRNNDFYNNTSGKYLPTDLDSINEQTLDPQYVDAANNDFRVGANLKEKGSPTADIGT